MENAVVAAAEKHEGESGSISLVYTQKEDLFSGLIKFKISELTYEGSEAGGSNRLVLPYKCKLARGNVSSPTISRLKLYGYPSPMISQCILSQVANIQS